MPDLIADALGCVGEEHRATGSTSMPLEPLYRSTYPDGSHPRRARRRRRDGRRGRAGVRPGRGRRLPALRRLRLEALPLRDERLHRPEHRLAARRCSPRTSRGWRRSAASASSRRRSTSTSRTRACSGSCRSSRCTPGLSPYDALAIYAVIAYMDSVAGVFFPQGRHARGAARARRRGREARRRPSATTPRSRASRRSAAPRRRRAHRATASRIACDAVVLNPDLPVAYRDLLGLEPWSVRRLKYSPSCFLLLAGSTRDVLEDRAPQHPLRPSPGAGCSAS